MNPVAWTRHGQGNACRPVSVSGREDPYGIGVPEVCKPAWIAPVPDVGVHGSWVCAVCYYLLEYGHRKDSPREVLIPSSMTARCLYRLIRLAVPGTEGLGADCFPPGISVFRCAFLLVLKF